MMFGPDYAENRTDVEQGRREAMDQLTVWMQDGLPFLHLRFADGEFHSLVGTAPSDHPNSDGHKMFTETMGMELRRVLAEISAWEMIPCAQSRMLIGGDWSTEPDHRQFLVDCELLRTIPWCPSQVFVSSIEDGSVVPFLRALIDYGGPKHLIGNLHMASVARALGAELVLVGESDAWLRDAAMRRCITSLINDRFVNPGAVFLYACGMPAEVWGWHGFKIGGTHIDVGSFFDLAAGRKTRVWHLEETAPHSNRVEAYKRLVMPLLSR